MSKVWQGFLASVKVISLLTTGRIADSRGHGNRASVRSSPGSSAFPASPPEVTSHRARLAPILAAVAAVLAAAAPASAHVDVLPAKVEQNTATEFTVRVPTERNVPTTAVEVRFPAKITVFSFQPTPGWTRTVLRKADDTVIGVRYTGGRIGVGEYQDFTFLGTPFGSPGPTAWQARQTYADGKVKPWVGRPRRPARWPRRAARPRSAPPRP